MKILFVSPFPPDRDGIGTYSQMIIGELRSMGHEALVILPRAQRSHSDDVIGVLSVRRSDLTALTAKVAAWQPDVIHVQFAVAAFGIQTYTLLAWLRLARAATGVRIVATMHEVTRDTAKMRGPGRALYRSLATQCDQLIVHTQSALTALTGPMAVPKEKVSVVPHPAARPPRPVSTTADLRARFDLDQMEILLAFGFIHVDKGLDDVVEALGILRSSDIPSLDNIRLVVAGAVRPRQGIFRLFELRDRLHLARVLRNARATGVIRNLIFTGYVPEDDIAGWFRTAVAVVLPYRKTEQSGVAALADSFDVPVLASSAGGLGERYPQSRWSFPPREPMSLAHVLSRFLQTPPDERAVIAASYFPADLSEVVDTTLDLYHGVATWQRRASGQSSARH
jgi:glycosyltransferase involved in cell wall biosynthesis